VFKSPRIIIVLLLGVLYTTFCKSS
jgi:hypothetical protein